MVVGTGRYASNLTCEHLVQRATRSVVRLNFSALEYASAPPWLLFVFSYCSGFLMLPGLRRFVRGARSPSLPVFAVSSIGSSQCTPEFSSLLHRLCTWFHQPTYVPTCIVVSLLFDQFVSWPSWSHYCILPFCLCVTDSGTAPHSIGRLLG